VQKSKDYYVYLHRKATTGDVFYVGKGKNRRSTHTFNRNIYWERTVNKYGFTVEIVLKNLTEKQALDAEIDYIDFFGIENLCNLTKGGEGLSMNLSEDHKKKIGNSNKGKKRSLELRKRISDSLKGFKHTEEAKKKISIASSNRTKETTEKRILSLSKKVLCSNGMIFLNTRFAEEWLRLNVNQKANANKITECRNGKRKSAYGYTWSYA
jgi:hypothetical protein